MHYGNLQGLMVLIFQTLTMSNTVDISRKIFGKNGFTTVIDTNFSELIPADNQQSLSVSSSVAEFFQTYSTLFYDIPSTGSTSSTNTHLDLVNQSSAYLGISYQDLLTELQQTRQENVSLKNQIFTLTGA